MTHIILANVNGAPMPHLGQMESRMEEGGVHEDESLDDEEAEDDSNDDDSLDDEEEEDEEEDDDDEQHSAPQLSLHNNVGGQPGEEDVEAVSAVDPGAQVDEIKAIKDNLLYLNHQVVGILFNIACFLLFRFDNWWLYLKCNLAPVPIVGLV